eukprot:2748110-Pleurochrysis_carterae.AAC.1
MSVPLARGRTLSLFSIDDLAVHVVEVNIPLVNSASEVIIVKSVVLLYRLDSAAPLNNRRGGAIPTMIMMLEVLRGWFRRGKP